MLFKWRHHEHGIPEYDPLLQFSGSEGTTNPRDYLTREERSAIREAALEYGSVPTYDNLSPEERDRWKAYLAQRFEKPKADVSPGDWERANGWKIPSLVWTSLDAGLRPVEVERAVTDWVDCQNGVLRIPKQVSAKNTNNWIVSLQDRTIDFMQRWLRQRNNYPQYVDTNALWLTRQSNPYQSGSLRYVLRRLCEVAGIALSNRREAA